MFGLLKSHKKLIGDEELLFFYSLGKLHKFYHGEGSREEREVGQNIQ
jgi:hypothetical protein